jgi:hypothetical protein
MPDLHTLDSVTCLQCRASRQEPQNVVQLLRCYISPVELEMRAAEEPLRSNLDVAELRSRVLERVEELEER